MNFLKNETLREYMIPCLGQTLKSLNFGEISETLDKRDFKAADKVVEIVIDIYNKRHL